MPISTSKNYDEFSEEINKERGLSGRDSYEDGETKWYNMYDAMNVGFVTYIGFRNMIYNFTD